MFLKQDDDELFLVHAPNQLCNGKTIKNRLPYAILSLGFLVPTTAAQLPTYLCAVLCMHVCPRLTETHLGRVSLSLVITSAK